MSGFPDEGVLPDDYPVYADYLYVCDGKPWRSHWHDISVGRLKYREGFTEVRRCNIEARRKALDLQKTPTEA